MDSGSSFFQCTFSVDHSHEVRSNHYLPLYSKVPDQNLKYEELFDLCLKRLQFHKAVIRDEGLETLDYVQVWTLSNEFSIPVKKFRVGQKEITEDPISFFGLLAVSSRSQESLNEFASSEAKLMYYRMRVSALGPEMIPDYFWKDPSFRIKLIAGTESHGDELFYSVPFLDTIKYIGMEYLDIQNGKSRLSINQVHQIASLNFKEKILENAAKFADAFHQNQALIDSLADELKIYTTPKIQNIISLDTLDEVARRSFPPCMYRIYNAMNKASFISSKARFEMILFFKQAGLDYFQQNDYWKDKVPEVRILNLRHFYAMDQSKQDYQAHNCSSMGSREVPADKYIVQGCPFKSLSQAEMRTLLMKMQRNVDSQDIEDIVLMPPNEAQIACRMFFDATFKQRPYELLGFSHPIDYATESEWRYHTKY